MTTDPKSGKSTSNVVYEGDPKVETEVTKLEVGGRPHTVLVNKKTGATIKDLGETGEKPPTVNVNSGMTSLDRETARFGKPYEKGVSDAATQLEKIADARQMVTSGATGQALGIPKLLTALVSGAGSGVRITQAELNSIGNARGIEGSVEGFFNKLSGAGSLTKEQQQQMVGILDTVRDRIRRKQDIANEALDPINKAGSREEIIQHDQNARKKVTDLERSGSNSSSGGHVIQMNGKNYQYKGTGDTGDLKNYTEVKK